MTDAQCRNVTCPPDKTRARLSDSGRLYLQVSPAGSKRWFLKHRIAGVEKQLSLGGYPDVALTAARKARDAAKLKESDGLDPLQVRKLEKLKAARTGDDTFKAVALKWYGKQSLNGAQAKPNARCGNWSASCSRGSARGPWRKFTPWSYWTHCKK